MAIVWQKLQQLNFKKALAVILLAGFTAFLVSSLPVKAAGPEFNVFPVEYGAVNNDRKDLPLIDAKVLPSGSYSSSQPDHDNGVQVNPDGTIRVSVYFHNGTPDLPENIARNVRIQAFANPTLGANAVTHTLSATISADNAAPVSSSSPGRGGDIQIHIQGAQAQSLSLVPGSVKLFKDHNPFIPLEQRPAPVTLPDTIFSSGVSVGDVRGCWEFLGFVNFDLRVSNVQQGDLQIQKQVRRIHNGGSAAFADEVTADPGQTVQYRIMVSAINSPVQNIRVRDSLDPKLTLSGNVTVDGNVVNSSEFFSSGGALIGTVTPGTTRVITFSAVIAGADQFTVGTHDLNNVATAFTDQRSVQDNALVRVTKQAPPQITCVFTWDAPLIADGSQRGQRRVGERFNVRQQVNNLASNQAFNIVFQHASGNPTFRFAKTATAASTFDQRNEDVISSSVVTGDYNAFVEVNNVNVVVCPGFRVQPAAVQNLTLVKQVRDDAVGGNPTGSVNNVQPGGQVTFFLTVSTSGSNVDLTNVNLTDTLPGRLTFVPGSLNINGNPSNASLSSINLGTLAPNSTVAITFRATAASASNFTVGQCEVLVNTATVTSGSLSDVKTASVQVCRAAPTKAPGSPGSRPQ